MKTDFETLKLLASYVINCLMDQKLITFNTNNRGELIEKMATEFGVSFSTDEDIIQRAIEEVEDKMGSESITGDITETEMFNHARKEIIKSFQGESIAGLYLEETLNEMANRIKDFLLDADLVEDVFATDEELVGFLVAKIRVFSPKRV